jgi:hypothetical protein
LAESVYVFADLHFMLVAVLRDALTRST